MPKNSKNIQQNNEQSKTFNLGEIVLNSLPNNDLSLDEYLNKFEIFIKSHIEIYYCLNQVSKNNITKILTDKVITEQCEYLTNLFLTVNKIPILSTKSYLLDSIKNECLVQNDKFNLEKTYNILYNKISKLKDDFIPVSQNSLRIINLSNNSRVEIEHEKYYSFIIEYIDDTLNEIDKIFTTKRFNESNQSKPIQTTIKTQTKAIEPIKLDATQTQIVFLFQKLIDEKLINETLNPKLWQLVSTYFVDKDNKALKNIHQTKDNLKNTKTGEPKSKSDIITKIVTDTKKTL